MAKVERDSLVYVLEGGLDSRVDEDKFFHVRLRLTNLYKDVALYHGIRTILLPRADSRLEVYPGQKSIEVAEDLIIGLIDE